MTLPTLWACWKWRGQIITLYLSRLSLSDSKACSWASFPSLHLQCVLRIVLQQEGYTAFWTVAKPHSLPVRCYCCLCPCNAALLPSQIGLHSSLTREKQNSRERLRKSSADRWLQQELTILRLSLCCTCTRFCLMSWGPSGDQQTKFCLCKFSQTKYTSYTKNIPWENHHIHWTHT